MTTVTQRPKQDSMQQEHTLQVTQRKQTPLSLPVRQKVHATLLTLLIHSLLALPRGRNHFLPSFSHTTIIDCMPGLYWIDE